MVDENIIEEAAPYAADPPNPNRVYRNYLLSCRRQGIEPLSRERAVELQAAARSVRNAPVSVAFRSPAAFNWCEVEKKTAPKGGSRWAYYHSE